MSDAFPVQGQERGQRSHHLFGSLLKTLVAAAGNDHALDVVRGQPHRVRGSLANAFAWSVPHACLIVVV